MEFLTPEILTRLKRYISVEEITSCERLLLLLQDKLPNTYKSMAYGKAEHYVTTLPVSLTGAKKGNILVGCHSVSKNAIIKVQTNVLLHRSLLNTIKQYQELYEKYIGKLVVPITDKQLTILNKKIYTEIFSEDNDFISGKVSILQCGNDNVLTENLTESELNEIVNKEMDTKVIEDAIVANSGKSSTLLFMKNFWRVETGYTITREVKSGSLVVFVNTGTIEEKGSSNHSYITIPFDNTVIITFGLLDSEEKQPEATIIFPSFFTPAGYKSLIQKIVRYRPKKVTMGESEYPSEEMLSSAIINLSKMGAFVPNIQRYVYGIESVCKRLAVCGYEDSNFRITDMVTLISVALLSNKLRDWRPNGRLMKHIVDIAIKLYRNSSYLIIAKKRTSRVTTELTVPERFCSYGMDVLKSFPGDLELVRNYSYGLYEEKQSVLQQPEKMDVCHCIDQHWLPIIGYYFSRRFVKAYSTLFSEIFKRVTGINSRFSKIKHEEFEREVYRVQHEVYSFLVNLGKPYKEPTLKDEKVKMQIVIPAGYISGAIGTMKIKVGRDVALVTSNPNDPLVFKAVKEISARTKKHTPLTDDQVEESINKAMKVLETGVPFRDPPLPSFKNSTISLSKEGWEYYVEGKKWEDVRHRTVSVKEIQGDELFIKPIGVVKNYEDEIVKLLEPYEDKILSRVIFYLSSVSVIKMNEINRDGTGDNIDVDDTVVFRHLLKISTIAPILFSLTNVTTFTVNNFLLSSKLRDTLIRVLRGRNVKEGEWKLEKSVERKLYTHQDETLNTLKKNRELGRKGNFIWLPVGSGKTAIVINYLRYLSENALVPYVIYTLPPESILSIHEEFKMYGFRCELFLPTKSSKNYGDLETVKEVSANTVTFILHDHLRLCREELVKISHNAFLIVDEVHLFLNQSKRTEIGIELSKLCNEFIAMTGTPIVDNRAEKLARWLQAIVPFPVNKSNFWVSASAMIAYNVESGIPKEEVEIEFDIPEEVSEEYYSHIPPKLGGRKVNVTYEDWMKAFEICYTLVKERMVKETEKLLKNGRRVMVVCRNLEECEELEKKMKKITSKVFVITSNSPINLTDENVRRKEVPPYEVVIVPKNRAQGYTLTYLNVMVTSVYPSNSATREQLRGRIDRIGQKFSPITYLTIHCGLLSRLHRFHLDASNLLSALKEIFN